jgi:hypothetical protein
MSDYSNIKKFEQCSFRAEVDARGLLRFSDAGGDVLYLHPSQIPALVIWLQEVQLAPFRPEPEPDPRSVFYPELETCKPLTLEEMRKEERLRLELERVR